MLHHNHPQEKKKCIIIRVPPPPIFIFLCPIFFEFFVHCVCLVDRVRVIVDKTSGINETEKKKKKLKIVLKYFDFDQSKRYIDTFHGMKFQPEKVS